MDDKDFNKSVRDFFVSNEAGKELLRRWEGRVQTAKANLAYANDHDAETLKRTIIGAERVFFPEINMALTPAKDKQEKKEETE